MGQYQLMPPPHARRRTVLRYLAVGGAAALAVLIGAAIVFLPSENDIRRRLERGLSARFDADVTLAELHVSLIPRLKVEGAGLKLVPRNRPHAPPLLVVSRFTARAPWRNVFLRPRRVSDVELSGMRITIAHKPDDDGVRDKEHGACQGERHPLHASDARPAQSSPVLIEKLTAPGTEIVLLPRNPAKLPRRFSIASLNVRGITLDQPLDFDAVLTNPTPRGLITAHGRFGPWMAGDPGLSPVEGKYVFEHADLGTIKGLGGMLTSSGGFGGVLEQILVAGATDTPDFSLDTAHNPLPLHTNFEACVDGTDGDTYLDTVRARLASTPISVRGRVEGKVGVHGRTIALDASVDGGRIEDVLRLAVKGDQQVMTGQVSLTTTLLLPPGEESVVERLQLNGQFGIARTRFSGPTVQGKIDEFSRRGRGRPLDQSVSNVSSELAGRFTLGRGTLRLQGLSFNVPGARVRLRGTYGLVTEQIDFTGTVRLDAKVSQTTSGFKSTLLKAADPLFSRKNAGTVLPIEISGTRSHPKFGVDVKGVLTRKVK